MPHQALAVIARLSVTRALPVERQLQQRMLELYQHDLSDIWDQDLDEAGCFGYALDRYFDDHDCSPYIFKVDGRAAGFALVDGQVRVAGGDYWMDQFFVLKKYRAQGVGSAAAAEVFRLHPGKWQVGQMTGNLPAQAFWRRTVSEFSGGSYAEVQLVSGWWQGIVQSFDSRKKI